MLTQQPADEFAAWVAVNPLAVEVSGTSLIERSELFEVRATPVLFRSFISEMV